MLNLPSSSPSYVFFNSGSTSRTALVLNVYSGSTLVSTYIPTEYVVVGLNYLYIAGPIVYPTPGTYRLQWVATGYERWEEVQVTSAPLSNASPNIPVKYRTPFFSATTPVVYVVDVNGQQVDECGYPYLYATATSTATSFTLPNPASFTVTFDSGTAQTVTLTPGAMSLSQLVLSINASITGGRALVAGSTFSIRSDTRGFNTRVEIGGDTATLTALGLTAGYYAPAWLDSPLSLSTIDSGANYETTTEISLAEGQYILLYGDASDNSITSDDVILITPNSCERTTLQVINSTNSQPIFGVEVAVIDSSNYCVGTSYTDNNGYAHFMLNPAEYKAVIRYPNVVFTTNNFGFTVYSRSTEVYTDNDFILVTGYSRPVFNDNPIIGNDQLSWMRAQFINLRGDPVVGIRVIVANFTGVYTVTNMDGTTAAVAGKPVAYSTDGLGQINAPVLRGATVEVVVEGTSLRRRFTIPNTPTFNLFDYFSTQDQFDIVRLRAPAAIQEDI